MKGWTKKTGSVIEKPNHQIQYTTDSLGNEYFRYYPLKRNKRLVDVADQSKLLQRSIKRKSLWKRIFNFIRRLFVISIAFLGVWYLIFFYFGGKTFVSPIQGSTAKALQLIPCYECKFTEEELENFYNRHTQVEAKEVAKVQASEEIYAVVEKYFGEIADEALTCFKSESGLRPTAVNYSNRNHTLDIGLAQVNTVHCGKVNATSIEDCKAKLLDLDTNVRVAKQIYDGRGWNAWYGRSCKQFWK